MGVVCRPTEVTIIPLVGGPSVTSRKPVRQGWRDWVVHR